MVKWSCYESIETQSCQISSVWPDWTRTFLIDSNHDCVTSAEGVMTSAQTTTGAPCAMPRWLGRWPQITTGSRWSHCDRHSRVHSTTRRL